MKTLVVYDIHGWAYHGIATGIKRYASTEVHICDLTKFGEMIKSGKANRYNGILCLSWSQSPNISSLNTRCVSALTSDGCRWNHNSFPAGDWRTKVVTKSRNRRTALQVLARFDELIAINPSLDDWAESKGFISRYLPQGVDSAMFTPAHRSRGDKIRVGWCGQHTDTNAESVKGFREVLNPVRESLRGEPVVFDVHSANRWHDSYKSTAEMRDWYRSLDLFLCTSISEGGPLPVLEAQACGVPVISTDVGDVASILNAETTPSGFLVPAYRNEATAEQTRARIIEHLKGYVRDATMEAAARANAIEKCWSKLADVWIEAAIGEH